MFGVGAYGRKPKTKEKGSAFLEDQALSQTGYLWGGGKRKHQIGPRSGWHWRATRGQIVMSWTLWCGEKEIGVSLFPTNETGDWPMLLETMLKGLNGED